MRGNTGGEAVEQAYRALAARHEPRPEVVHQPVPEPVAAPRNLV